MDSWRSIFSEKRYCATTHLMTLNLYYKITSQYFLAHKVPFPHLDFLKRANFRKIDISLYLLVQLYTKITKNINFEILANLPPFWRNENFSGLGNPVGESGTPAYLRSLKLLPTISRPKKPVQPNFRSFGLLVHDLRSFYSFFEKISMDVISVSVFRCFRFTENLSSPTVFKISACGFSHSNHN